MNGYVEENEPRVPILYIDEGAAERQIERLQQLRRDRDAAAVARTLAALARGTAAGENTMPLLIDAVRAYATLGEMCDALRTVWGEYEEVPVI